MRIDRKLNLVIPIERDPEDGPKVYVHSTPLHLDVFEAYSLVISKTFAAIYQEGLNVVAGPRVAAMILKRVAKDMGRWEGPEGVENGLMAEIRRTSNVIAPQGHGWGAVPLQDAISRGVLSEDELSEVEGAICFFIVASAMHRKTELAKVLAGMTRLWDAELSSFNCTEFANSLPTSTPGDATGERATPSSIPS